MGQCASKTEAVTKAEAGPALVAAAAEPAPPPAVCCLPATAPYPDERLPHAPLSPEEEKERLQALLDCHVLDTPAERSYDAITQLLCSVFKVPVAVVGLIGEDRLWFKSITGLESGGGNRLHSFCDASLRLPRPTMMVVPDTLADTRFQHNQFVTTPPYVRFYCGAPLVSSEGQVLGSLAVLDIKPRTMPAEIANLMCSFAEVVVRELEKDKVEKMRRRQEETHLPLVRALRCFDEPVALCDVSPQGWPLKFVNSSWCQTLGASQDACLLSSGVWGFFHFAHDSDLAGMLYARAAIEEHRPFALRVAKGPGLARGSSGRAAPKPAELWVLEFRPATSDHLGSAQCVPQIAIPSLVQMGFQDLVPGEERVFIPKSLYFVVMKPAEPPQQAERGLVRRSGSQPARALLPATPALQLPAPVRVQRPSAGFQEPATPKASNERSLHVQPRDSGSVGAPRDSSSASTGMLSSPGSSAPWSPRPFSQDQPEELAEVTLGPLIGTGAHGKVHRGIWRGRKVAVKILDCITEQDQDVRDTSAVGPALEATISKDLAHPHIVKTFLYAVHQERQEMHGGKHFQQIWMVEEYCNRGTLNDAIDRGWLRASPAAGAPLNMRALLRTAQDVASAMRYLHERSILHGDLTPSNILLQALLGDSRGFVAKVADFGISRVLSAAACRTATIGTVSHMPAELLEGGIVSHATDVFSFGVLLWEMYTGEHAWAGCRVAQIVHAKTMRRQRLPALPADCPTEYKDLVERCLSDAPAARPTFPEIEGILAAMLRQD